MGGEAEGRGGGKKPIPFILKQVCSQMNSIFHRLNYNTGWNVNGGRGEGGGGGRNPSLLF